MSRLAVQFGVCVGVIAVLIFVFLPTAPARVSLGPPTTICGALSASFAADVKAKNYVASGVASQAYAAHGCYNGVGLPAALQLAGPQTKICKRGIKNIQAFLNECPTADPAYGYILQSTPISFDFAAVDPQTLATDVAAVCLDKTTLPQNGGPTLRQREEFRTVQALRVIYYMDSQGDVGCPYPWTGGKSFYKWMVSEEGGVNIRDDITLSQCCSPPVAGGTNQQIEIAMPNLAEPNLDISPDNYTWLGISGQISLIAHETRHEPIPPGPNGSPSFLHVDCCPAGSNACDQNYDETNLTTYGVEYWLNRAFLNGQVNVGYACMPDANTTQYLAIITNGFIMRFCSTKPPQVTIPAQPGGSCM
ncbi:MAG TPA: hypothetical protein VMU22_00390 [Rhizomicrobium sp.]|nr:hypothetical protein [Rhizomicrobium sp.]